MHDNLQWNSSVHPSLLFDDVYLKEVESHKHFGETYK